MTAKAGVANDRWGFGAVIGDYDNDGWPDIYVTNFGKNRLYHNNHDGTFTDVAEKAGVTLGNWSTGATWGDYDGDGRLDLFVPGYVHYDLAQVPPTGGAGARSFCQFRGVAVMCGPGGLKGEPDHLFHNNGDGTFTDVSVKAGVADLKSTYYGLASLFIDVNNDGRVDLLVADDSTPNYLYLNKGDGTFEDASFASGYALNESGRETASMGIAEGDMLHNGRIDLFNTTFSDDYKPLYINDGDGNFTDVSYQYGIAEPTVPFSGLGHELLRLRQRRLAGPNECERARVSASGCDQLGHDLEAAGAAVSQRSGQADTGATARGQRAGQAGGGAGHGVRRPVQRRAYRCRRQQYG